uniref:Uncharacterized protein n=1 Tax=Vitis vinifera TaxID=29760 RepID=A5BJN9_VITVI|nr:hypothetical protein VITISV_018949 [Vitis vinifera]
MSIQPMPILLPYLDVSHPESFSAATPPGCLTSGILPLRHSIRMPHIRNPSLPPLHPDASHPESFSAAIPSGYITSEILPPPFHPDISHPESYPPTFHLLRMSHIRSSIQPTFHLLRMSHIRNSIQPTFHLFLHS